MSDNLKPCPCGQPAKFEGKYRPILGKMKTTHYRVCCSGTPRTCTLGVPSTQYSEVELNVIEAWNTRPREAVLEVVLREASAALEDLRHQHTLLVIALDKEHPCYPEWVADAEVANRKSLITSSRINEMINTL